MCCRRTITAFARVLLAPIPRVNCRCARTSKPMASGRAGAAAGITMTAMSTRREVPDKIEDRLIVALDVPAVSEARALIDKLEGVVSFFKVGLWLQFAAGFDGLLDYLLAK